MLLMPILAPHLVVKLITFINDLWFMVIKYARPTGFCLLAIIL